MTTVKSALFNTTDLVLELDQATIDQAWSASATASNPASRWQNYLNQLALAVFLPWLQETEDAAAQTLWQESAQNDVWELVNGTAISIQDAKLVLIPSEADDLEELRVPQEWIDIPDWIADYYLAVQVNVDAGYIRVWSYTTHQKLKFGSFDHQDRTYSLTDDQLMRDLNVLWVTRELCPDEVTQAAIEPISELVDSQADNLIERLGNPAQLSPRLVVHFALWGALLQNPTWLSRLVAHRRGMAIKTPVLQWLKQGLTNISTELGWRQIELTLSGEGARGVSTTGKLVPNVGLAKKLTIEEKSYELKILPLVTTGGWRFELRCITLGYMIPAGFKLKLLTADGRGFVGNEDVAVESVPQLALEIDLDPGESLIWQVEPTPDNYQQEVLQF